MRISPAAFSWLVRIDHGGTLLVDTWNGCIRNLRAASMIRYTHKSNGCVWRRAELTDIGREFVARSMKQ